MGDEGTVMAIMVVKFRSRLSADEIRRMYPERMPAFREVPGLVQKYHVYDESTGEWGGIYLWDSRESMQSFLDSDLRKTIPSFYEVEGSPRLKMFSVEDILRA